MNANNPTGENGNKLINGRKPMNVVRDESADRLLEKFFGDLKKEGRTAIHLHCVTELEIPKDAIKFKDDVIAKRMEISKARFERDAILSIKTGTGKKKQTNKGADVER